MLGRGRIHQVAGVTIVDESYNASPASVTQSLAMLSKLPARRRIAVLGDMRELGDEAEALHRGVGTEVGSLPIDALYWLGERGAIVAQAARSVRPGLAARTHTEMSALVADVVRDARDGDAMLVKASRAMKLDEFVSGVVDALQRRGGK